MEADTKKAESKKETKLNVKRGPEIRATRKRSFPSYE